MYPILLVRALIEHTLSTVDRGPLDPTMLIWYIPLTAASIWSVVDLWREDQFRHPPVNLRIAFYEGQEKSWQRALVAARASGDQRAVVAALATIGFWLDTRDRYEEATPYLTEALTLAHALGDQPVEEERALYGLGLGAFHRGQLDEDEDLFRESLAAVATTHDRRDEIADLYAHVGEFLGVYREKREEGCQMLAKAQGLSHEVGQSSPRWLEEEQRMAELRRKYGDETAQARRSEACGGSIPDVIVFS